MLASAGPSLPNFNPGERKAVVISLARANDRGDTTVVLCLDKSGMRDPFRLSNQGGRYIWSNQELRDNGIEVGSIISYQSCYRGCLYSGNTGKKVVSLALSLCLSTYHFILTLLPRFTLDQEGSFVDRPSTTNAVHEHDYSRLNKSAFTSCEL